MASAASNDLNEIRVDHIGSLVRPAKLRELFARFDRKQASSEELRQTQDEAIQTSSPARKPMAFRLSPTANFAVTTSKRVFQKPSPASTCRKTRLAIIKRDRSTLTHWNALNKTSMKPDPPSSPGAAPPND